MLQLNPFLAQCLAPVCQYSHSKSACTACTKVWKVEEIFVYLPCGNLHCPNRSPQTFYQHFNSLRTSAQVALCGNMTETLQPFEVATPKLPPSRNKESIKFISTIIQPCRSLESPPKHLETIACFLFPVYCVSKFALVRLILTCTQKKEAHEIQDQVQIW